jgi:hypothetical protein
MPVGTEEESEPMPRHVCPWWLGHFHLGSVFAVAHEVPDVGKLMIELAAVLAVLTEEL